MKIIEVPIDSLSEFDLEYVTQQFLAVDGVSDVSVLEITGQIMVYGEGESLTQGMLMECLRVPNERPPDGGNVANRRPVGLGGAVAEQGGSSLIHLRVQGMHCAGCERAIEQVVSTVEGVAAVKAELVTGRATISGNEFSTSSVIAAIKKAGYPSEVVSSRASFFKNIREMHRQTERKLFWRWGLAFIAILLFLGLRLLSSQYEVWWHISVVAACIVQLICGVPYVLSALRLARYGQTNMDTLIALGTTAAFIGALRFAEVNNYDMLMESPMILGVVGFGKWLESRSINRAVNQLAVSVQPEGTVLKLLEDDSFEEVGLEEIVRGMAILVRSGEQVPLDGIVRDAAADVNRAWLTGEAQTVRLSEGEMVHAGAVNEGDNFSLTVTSESGETRFDKIMDRLESSLVHRPRIQQLADKVVAVFVPVLLLIASLTFLGWFFGGDGSYETAWRYTVAVLVIACPCALGLATPVATLVSGTRALGLGGLITNPMAMERLNLIDRFILDKTGTLTTAELEVQEFRLLDESLVRDQVLQRVRVLEQQSTHPIAKSIVSYCEETLQQTEALAVCEVQTMVGSGIYGVIDKQSIALVNDFYVAEKFEIELSESFGNTRVWVILDEKVSGCLFLAASCYPGVREVVSTLQAFAGSSNHVLMASGDNEQACLKTANQVGIQMVHSEMSPEDKVGLVASLKADGNSVAIVGDGINDAVALAEADVGIAAFGGADIAAQSADIVMIQPGLEVLLDLIALSRETRFIIRQNLCWAFLYNVLAIPLAAGVLVGFGITLTPMLAAGIMATSSILVVLNSLRLNRISLV